LLRSPYFEVLVIEYCSGVVPKTSVLGGELNETTRAIHLTDEQRLDWLRLIRSQNVGPRGIMAQTPQAD
jgi:hypothetical protein